MLNEVKHLFLLLEVMCLKKYQDHGLRAFIT